MNSLDAKKITSLSKHFDAIIFDLGGVLIENAGASAMLTWIGKGITEPELWRRWLLSSAVRNFESGKSGSSEFATAVVNEFALPITPDEFITTFASWLRGFYPGAPELLHALAPHFSLVCLSNTNEIHWGQMKRDLQLPDFFDFTFPSFQTGKLKPDQDTFDMVIKSMGASPKRILFFDDISVNIAAAKTSGIVAHQVIGASEVIQTLASMEID